MSKEIVFKEKMEMDEMKAAFVAENPYLKPNGAQVGRFARKHGYRLMKQMENYKLYYFYLKKKED